VISFSGGSRSCAILRAGRELRVVLAGPRAGARGEAGCTAARRGRAAAGAGEGEGLARGGEGGGGSSSSGDEERREGGGAPVFGFIGACAPTRGARARVRARFGGHEACSAASVPAPRPGGARRSTGRFVTVVRGIRFKRHWKVVLNARVEKSKCFEMFLLAVATQLSNIASEHI
jgi:hypothetical protein